MNTMTTNEAAKLAATLYGEGMKYKAIGRKIAKAGYLSFRTGKPIGASGIATMVKKYTGGIVIADRKMQMHAKRSKRYTPQLPAATESATVARHPPVATQRNVRDELLARSVLKEAIQKVVKRLFDADVVVSLPLDKVFHKTHA